MTWPSLPVGAGISGGYNGQTWTVRVTWKDRVGTYGHPDLWRAIQGALMDYRARK